MSYIIPTPLGWIHNQESTMIELFRNLFKSECVREAHFLKVSPIWMTMEDARNKWHIQCNARLNTSCTAENTGQASGPGWHTTIGNPQLEPQLETILNSKVGTTIESYTFLVKNWNYNRKSTVGTAIGNYYIPYIWNYNRKLYSPSKELKLQ